jgi:hypothetical protein
MRANDRKAARIREQADRPRAIKNAARATSETARKRSMLTTKLLPGVPLVESPFFDQDVNELPPQYQAIARQLHDRGFAVLDFPDDGFDRKAEAIKSGLAKRFGWADPAACQLSARVQDAWRFDDNVRDIAGNAKIVALLSALYGRPAFPFQTLNFPVGTQQPVHSDHVHFSSIPERFMCGVWVALEDVDEDNGPLFYYPGSHRWPCFGNEQLGVSRDASSPQAAIVNYIDLYEAMPRQLGVARETFVARKGQALIWASNLLHGGSQRNDPKRSRWSQVTHYYFEGCRYTTPLQSDVTRAKQKFRRPADARNRDAYFEAMFKARGFAEKALSRIGWPGRRRAPPLQ